MNEKEALAIITNALDDDSMIVYEALQILHTLERKCSSDEARVKLLEQQVDAMDKAVMHTQRLYEASQRVLTKVLVENRENAEALEVALGQQERLQDALLDIEALADRDKQIHDGAEVDVEALLPDILTLACMALYGMANGPKA